MANNYPLITAATVVTAITLLLNIMASFGILLTPEQRSGILELVALLAPWAVVWWGHRTTTPLAKPTTETGLPLTGPDGELTDAQTRSIQKGK